MKRKFITLVGLLFIMTVLISCGSQPAEVTQIESQQEVSPTNEPQAADTPVQAQEEVSFSQDILPIFQEIAGNCHGTSGGLSLESYEGVMAVVVAGNPEDSLLWKRLNGEAGPIMPPTGKLSDDLLQLIYLWIQQGAKNN
jgi:hypothetical protein